MRSTLALLLMVCLIPTVVADSHVGALRRALEGRSWMSLQDTWPCNYRGSLYQERTMSESDIVVRSFGRFWHDCKRGLIWEMNRPRTDVRVYTNSRNDLVFRGSGRVRQLDGLVDRQIGVLMRSIFSGNLTALADDFALSEVTEEAVRLVPRDPRAAAHLKALVLSGDEQMAIVRLEPADGKGDSLKIEISEFAHDTSKREQCERWLASETNACDGLRSPLRYLER